MAATIYIISLDKKYGRRKIIHKFPNKPWSASGLDKLIKKIDNTGGTDRTNGSGRPKSVRTQDNIDDVSLRVLSLVHIIHQDKFLKLPVSPSLPSDVSQSWTLTFVSIKEEKVNY